MGDGQQDKYFILFVCMQVVISNYILQHNPNQKVEYYEHHSAHTHMPIGYSTQDRDMSKG